MRRSSNKYRLMKMPLFALLLTTTLSTAAPAGGIQWHGTWKGGLAEAQRTGKPILLVSGVPQCHNVPGVW